MLLCAQSSHRPCPSFDLALALDQDAVLNPPKKPKAFTSFGDAVEQLLPYHVFQIHEDDLLTDEKRTPQQEAIGEYKACSMGADPQSSSSQRIW